MKHFTSRFNEIKKNARENVLEGPITKSYGGDVSQVIDLLNQALATELVCVLRYRFHHEVAKGINSISIADEFLEHAEEEQEHVNRLANRISQLGGKPNFSPVGLAERSHTDYVEGSSLREVITENLIAERITIGIYQELIRFVANGDPTTRRMIEKILKDEEAHATELANLISDMKDRDEKENPMLHERGVA